MINLQKHKMGRELRIRVKTVVKILVMVLRLQPMPGDLDPFPCVVNAWSRSVA